MSSNDDIDRYDLIDISFDFSKCLYGFDNYVPKRLQAPYSEEDFYLLYRLPAEKYMNLVVYQFRYLDFISPLEDLTEPFENYAYHTFLKFTDSQVFNSENLLNQLIITYWLGAIKHVYSYPRSTTNEAQMDTEKKQHDRIEQIVSHFLKILGPNIEKTSAKFQQMYPMIDYLEIYSDALFITKLAICGEDAKVIEKELENIITQSDKAGTKSRLRKLSLHSAYKHGRSKKKMDLSHRGMMDHLVQTLTNLYLDTGDDVWLRIGEDRVWPYFIADTLNINSNRIFKPNNKYNLPQFLFGKNGALMNRLHDVFKSDKKKKQHEDYDDRFLYENNFSPPSRGWKKHRNNFTKEERTYFYKIAKPYLTKNQGVVYSKWLENSYVSHDRNASKHLSDARKRLVIAGIDCPKNFL